MRILIGLLIAGVGVILILKTEWFIQNFGSSAWAEEKFGSSGGTRIMYKFIGLALIFVGFLVMTNMIGGFLDATLGKIFPKQTI